MDDRVVELRERLFSYRDKDGFPATEFREEILMLHAVVADESSRIELMRLFNVVADIVAVHLEDHGGDLDAFNLHRVEQMRRFLIEECRVGEKIDGERLRAVTLREIKAGRMHRDDALRRYALGDRKAFHPN